MAVNRIVRKTEWTPEDNAKHQAARELFREWHPGPKELLATGDYEVSHASVQQATLRVLMSELKKVREDKGLTLEQIANKSGIDQPNLSHLESGKNINPTLDTLVRYAAALGRALLLATVEVTPAASQSKK